MSKEWHIYMYNWFNLLLLLETVVYNPCLRVYHLKSIWIWVLGFRPESNRGPAYIFFSLQCRNLTQLCMWHQFPQKSHIISGSFAETDLQMKKINALIYVMSVYFVHCKTHKILIASLHTWQIVFCHPTHVIYSLLPPYTRVMMSSATLHTWYIVFCHSMHVICCLLPPYTRDI